VCLNKCNKGCRKKKKKDRIIIAEVYVKDKTDIYIYKLEALTLWNESIGKRTVRREDHKE